MAAPGQVQRMLSLFSNFHAGFRLADGDALRNLVGYLFGVKTGSTAGAGGTFAGALSWEGTNPNKALRVSTVATAADGVMLPQPIQGREVVLWNDGVNACQVFSPNTATGPSTIVAAGARTGAGVAGNVGVSLASGATLRLQCFDTDVWKILS